MPPSRTGAPRARGGQGGEGGPEVRRIRLRRPPTGVDGRSLPGPYARRVAWGRIEQRRGYRLWVGGPVPPGAAAWTLGSLVVVRRRYRSSARLLAHELEHVRQWREAGAVRFLVRYLGGYVHWRIRGFPHAAAYRRIPAEVDADWHARDADSDPRTGGPGLRTGPG